TPISRHTALPGSASLRPPQTAYRRFAGTCGIPCCPPTTCPHASVHRVAIPLPLPDHGGPWSPDPHSGTRRAGAGLPPRLPSLSAATDPWDRRLADALPHSVRRAPPLVWLPSNSSSARREYTSTSSFPLPRLSRRSSCHGRQRCRSPRSGTASSTAPRWVPDSLHPPCCRATVRCTPDFRYGPAPCPQPSASDPDDGL